MLHSSLSLSNLVTSAGFESITLRNIQRYGIANHLYWMIHQKPGGHQLWKEKFSQTTDNSYSEDLIKQGKSDTLWLTARKPLR
jgi:hypothetical protein